MRFAIGYQLPEAGEEPFADIVEDFKGHIEEVYFPWLDMPSGRAPLTNRRGFVDWDGQEKLETDLKAFREMGVKLDLLFNANCYGRYSLSQYLANTVCSVIDHLLEGIGLDVVTTTSPMIARVVKENFPEIDVRASVNMRIGSVKGMEYLADLFDSFHIQRAYNRDPGKIEEMKEWADDHGKRLCLLANSGCLNFCSGQVFHDNLVAHEMEVAETLNVSDWNPITCWNHYKNKDNRAAFLQNSWIRPEDLGNYENYFAFVKLATRMHANPRLVIRAYSRQKFQGNLLDLLEPGYGPAFSPYIIDNSRFPDDWFSVVTSCNKKCHKCDYCGAVLKRVLVEMPGY